jgi:dimethylglycine dehydrogenase
MISTPRAERWNFDDLSKLLPSDGSVTLRNVTNDRGCFTLVGPKARDVLQSLTEVDLSNEAFPWFGIKTGTVGLASDVRLLRVNYEGELGWELYHPLAYQRQLLEALLTVGKEHGLRLVGLHALESLRLDKSYRAMYRDMNPELSAWESGLDRFIRLDKGDFIGRQALLEEKERGVQQRIVSLAIEADGFSVLSNEGLYHQGKLVGRVTSGSYSYTFAHDIALGLLPVELAVPGAEFDVPVLGEMRKARVIEESPYDPEAKRARL